MFSISRSRYALPVQFVFLTTNAIGVVLAISYNANTPDLYPGNAHHKIGWIATWIVCAQIFVGAAGRVAGVLARGKGGPGHSSEEQQAFIPVSTENMAEYQRTNEELCPPGYRHSNDSGQGTEPNTESLRSSSLSTSGQQSPREMSERRLEYEYDDLEFKEAELAQPNAQSSFAKVVGKISTRGWKVLLLGYNTVDRTILILGSIALATGIITWARFFVSLDILNRNCAIR